MDVHQPPCFLLPVAGRFTAFGGDTAAANVLGSPAAMPAAPAAVLANTGNAVGVGEAAAAPLKVCVMDIIWFADYEEEREKSKRAEERNQHIKKGWRKDRWGLKKDGKEEERKKREEMEAERKKKREEMEAERRMRRSGIKEDVLHINKVDPRYPHH